ncbi:putative CMP-sialic acid transporter [Trypanosoma theileri]|uniref:Putative CMP-sialic acid transporter n=1 Tax=Trypanosoma theileri TaxID=67003 RepID=A0A1X0NTD6_9TRYP|nr:putative CMP-sialic acid transporter [Trypanosoma theileri]ORC87449.1 putative CMP-sialic acid transporter [Trypanosoma theileri]
MLAIMRNTFHVFSWIRSMCSIQLFFLALLTLQNSTAVMLMSYTQQRQVTDASTRFQVSHVVMMQEVTKVIASLLWCAVDVYLAVRLHGRRLVEKAAEEMTAVVVPVHINEASSTKPIVYVEEMRSKSGETATATPRGGGLDVSSIHGSFPQPSSAELWLEFKRQFLGELFNPGALWMMGPAVIYAIQNYTLFVALGNMEPTLFQVTYQSKILVMAVFMWIFLNRSFSRRQWMALTLLVMGVATTQIGSQRESSSKKEKPVIQGSYLVGIAATTTAVFLSSTASVLMEAIFKGKTSAIDSFTSTKNVHLSFYSVICFLVVQLINGNSNNSNNNTNNAIANADDDQPIGALTLFLNDYFHGFDWLVWLLVLVQALGGLLVAVVIKYSDNIMKAFATGCAIVLSGFCSAYIYSFMPSQLFILGNILCLTSIVMYSR